MILKSFLIVFACLFLGEVIVWLFKLPLPASIIGLLVLFIGLQAGWIKLESVQKLAKVMLDYLVLLVVPACISIMQYLQLIRDDFWVLLVATTVSTILVLISTAKTHQWLRRWQKKHYSLKSEGKIKD